MTSLAIEKLVRVVAIVALIREFGLMRKRGIHAIPTLLNPITMRASFIIRRLNDHVAIFVVSRNVNIIGIDASYINKSDFGHSFPEF